MDLTPTIEPRSDQLNADDLLTGPVTVTITGVTQGTPEQPVNIELAEHPGRPFKPSKSMRRVLVQAWGKDSALYIGRRMCLYRDPDITFGRDKVGGIRISHLSDIGKPMAAALTVSRGKRRAFVVEPLQSPSAATVDVDSCESVDVLRSMWQTATPDDRKQIEQRVAQLTAQHYTQETNAE